MVIVVSIFLILNSPIYIKAMFIMLVFRGNKYYLYIGINLTIFLIQKDNNTRNPESFINIVIQKSFGDNINLPNFTSILISF